jgi:DNA-binding CsgD family transcriptional regulator/GAF domain-containing protein
LTALMPYDRRITAALDRVKTRTGVSLAFAGDVDEGGNLWLRHFSGETMGALPGKVLRFDAGLGGRVAATNRPMAVNNYFQSDRISHAYDRIIQAEGLRAMVAAPIVLERQTVGVMYGAFRSGDVAGGRIIEALVDECRAVEHEIVTLTAIRSRAAADTDLARLQEKIRAAHASVRDLQARTTDRDAHRDLSRIAEMLISSGSEIDVDVDLTQRELDVLCLVAAGHSNRTIAERLGLGIYTVKGYMKTVMAKLDADTRYAAVARARAAGLLP